MGAVQDVSASALQCFQIRWADLGHVSALGLWSQRAKSQQFVQRSPSFPGQRLFDLAGGFMKMNMDGRIQLARQRNR